MAPLFIPFVLGKSSHEIEQLTCNLTMTDQVVTSAYHTFYSWNKKEILISTQVNTCAGARSFVSFA